MKEELKALIEKEFGILNDMDTLRKNQVFLEVQDVIVEIMQRDYNYILVIEEKKDYVAYRTIQKLPK